MTRLTLHNHNSPGDVLLMTAAVRDLHRAVPGAGRYRVVVDSFFPDLWANNPYVEHLPPPGSARRKQAKAIHDSDSLKGEVVIDCGHPPLLDVCNQTARHYLEAFHDLLERRLPPPPEPPEGLPTFEWVKRASGGLADGPQTPGFPGTAAGCGAFSAWVMRQTNDTA